MCPKYRQANSSIKTIMIYTSARIRFTVSARCVLFSYRLPFQNKWYKPITAFLFVYFYRIGHVMIILESKYFWIDLGYFRFMCSRSCQELSVWSRKNTKLQTWITGLTARFNNVGFQPLYVNFYLFKIISLFVNFCSCFFNLKIRLLFGVLMWI